jgi:DNA-binding beta-propeller fold protein YncE
MGAVLGAAAPRSVRVHLATARIAATRWPYLPGSRLPLRVDGLTPPYHVAILGIGRILSGNTYEVPPDSTAGTALLVAGNSAGLGAAALRIVEPPQNRALLLVASYDDGLILHDARNFSVLGVLATNGVPSDVAVAPTGLAAVTDTQGTELTTLRLTPWRVGRIAGVEAADEVAIDASTQTIFVTDRGSNGSGALTRIAPDGGLSRVLTGDTPEGLAVDPRRALVYVANANDGTIAFVDERSMRVVRRFSGLARVFSLALSRDGARLYAISNQAADSPFGRAGRAFAISLDRPEPRIAVESSPLTFPIGVALDDRQNTLFVTDEERREVDVLDAQTLQPKHAALSTCAIPWKPAFDAASERLYVPCAGDDRIDVFDTRTLQRVGGAPFVTGGYPLAVATWRP